MFLWAPPCLFLWPNAQRCVGSLLVHTEMQKRYASYKLKKRGQDRQNIESKAHVLYFLILTVIVNSGHSLFHFPDICFTLHIYHRILKLKLHNSETF